MTFDELLAFFDRLTAAVADGTPAEARAQLPALAAAVRFADREYRVALAEYRDALRQANRPEESDRTQQELLNTLSENEQTLTRDDDSSF